MFPATGITPLARINIRLGRYMNEKRDDDRGG
jgi:hypothetical protein